MFSLSALIHSVINQHLKAVINFLRVHFKGQVTNSLLLNMSYWCLLGKEKAFDGLCVTSDSEWDRGEVCCRSDRWVQGGCGITSGICSEPLLCLQWWWTGWPMRSGGSLCWILFLRMMSWSVVRGGSRWKRAYKGGGMHWRREERKLVQARQNTCENEKEAGVTV